MTELENILPFSGVDPRGRVKYAILLEMFQQMADADASKYQLSVRQTLSHNITWVLRKYRVDLEKYPTKDNGNLTIKTYAEIWRNLYSIRSFKIKDSQGQFLGSAYTWWVLLDFAKMRPIRLDKCDLVDAIRDQVTEPEELPRDVKVPKVTAPTIEETWKVRWQDLDVNNHTNHIVYFNWALDTVPDEVPAEMEPYFTEGEFLRAIPRTRVKCLTQEVESADGRAFLHSLRSIEDGSEYARLSSKWRKI